MAEQTATRALPIKKKLYITEDDIAKIIDKAADFDRRLIKLKQNEKTRKFIRRIGLLMMLVKDFANGDYEEVPWMTIASIVFALLFIINPFDAIPEMLPVIGVVDDVAVLALVWKATEGDLRKYVQHKKLKEEHYF